MNSEKEEKIIQLVIGLLNSSLYRWRTIWNYIRFTWDYSKKENIVKGTWISIESWNKDIGDDNKFVVMVEREGNDEIISNDQTT